MADREKLIELISEAHSWSAEEACFNDATYADQLRIEADHLIANGVTLRGRDCHWATEQAYKNGYEDGKKDAVKWIPVTERLPDLELEEVKTDDNDLVPCLAVRKHPRAKNGKYTAKVWYDGYGFLDGISNDVTDEVTHWMPLPEPPKE